MERLAFRCDRHEEITRHIRMRRIQMRHLYYQSNGNACVLLTFKNFRLVLLRFTRYVYGFLHLELNELLLF